MVYTRCDTAAFEWLAEVFSCGGCGGNDFDPADDEQVDSDISMEDSSDAANIAKRTQDGKEAIE